MLDLCYFSGTLYVDNVVEIDDCNVALREELA